jgi:hypothetical protein
MFIIYAVLFFAVSGILTIFVSARAAGVYYVLLGVAVFAGWTYHHDARPGYALMGWYNHATADSALVGYFMALTVTWCGLLFEGRKSKVS